MIGSLRSTVSACVSCCATSSTPPALSTNDLDTDDRVMRDERRVAVLITSARFTTNRR